MFKILSTMSPAPPIVWPFWSRYATAKPILMSKDVSGPSGSVPESRFQVADLVVAWTPPAGAEMTWQSGHCPATVRCMRNSSWDSAVGADHRVTEKMRGILSEASEAAPDWMTKQFGYTRMCCWVRE